MQTFSNGTFHTFALQLTRFQLTQWDELLVFCYFQLQLCGRQECNTKTSWPEHRRRRLVEQL